MATLAGGLLAAPALCRADARFDLSAELRGTPRALEVELRLRNHGSSGARAVWVEGELAGRRAHAELAALAAGDERLLTLRYPRYLPRPGRYALTLVIEHRPEQPPDAPPHSERAFALLDLGARPQPALDVLVRPATLDVEGWLTVVLESADGAAHRAGLRVLLPGGVNVLEAPAQVEVPAGGRVSVPVRVLRGSSARGKSHAVIVVASPLDGPLERASAALGQIQIAPDPAWLPRLRPALAALGALLLIAAAVLELRARRAPRPPTD